MVVAVSRRWPSPVFLALATSFVLGAACRPAASPATGDPAELELALQAMLDSVVRADTTLPGAALSVEAPSLGLFWSGAAGVAERTSQMPLTPQHPVRIASNTKTFVAAAILRLWEEEQLGLDDPVTLHLPEPFIRTMRNDGYQPDSITIRHLLTHTSGLFDYADSEPFFEAIMSDPMHRWSRAEQLQAAVDWGEPYGAPGAVYRYSDTGYILLGAIIEQVTGVPLAGALRDLLGYERLGLGATWLETLEPPPTGVADRAHQYLGEIDTYDFDPSFDLYGGGGLASSVEDLRAFIDGLFTGDVFANLATSDTMLATIHGAEAGPAAWGSEQVPGVYRMGIWVDEVEGTTVYMHTGFWGTLAAYAPDLNASIGAAVTQQESRALHLRQLLQRTLALLGESASTD